MNSLILIFKVFQSHDSLYFTFHVMLYVPAISCRFFLLTIPNKRLDSRNDIWLNSSGSCGVFIRTQWCNSFHEWDENSNHRELCKTWIPFLLYLIIFNKRQLNRKMYMHSPNTKCNIEWDCCMGRRGQPPLLRSTKVRPKPFQSHRRGKKAEK